MWWENGTAFGNGKTSCGLLELDYSNNYNIWYQCQIASIVQNAFKIFFSFSSTRTTIFSFMCTRNYYNDEWWINRACITDSMKFPIELFSAFDSLFSSFSPLFLVFVKKISLTFCWQFSCVSNQDIDFLISITKHELKVKTDIMNFE